MKKIKSYALNGLKVLGFTIGFTYVAIVLIVACGIIVNFFTAGLLFPLN